MKLTALIKAKNAQEINDVNKYSSEYDRNFLKYS